MKVRTINSEKLNVKKIIYIYKLFIYFYYLIFRITYINKYIKYFFLIEKNKLIHIYYISITIIFIFFIEFILKEKNSEKK